MSSELKYILIGLHDAGKTTYLAALWYLVQPNRHPTALRIDYLEGSSKYLNAIRTDWLEYKRVPRTFSASELAVSMRLKEQNSQRKMTLFFPDSAGESFEHQWSEREWTRAYQELLETAAGGLLFVNPDTIKTGLRIDQVDDVLADMEPETDESADEEHPSGEIPPWDKKESPTQVQLVEVLQFIRDSGVLTTRFRLAVIVSAWDRVEEPQITPAEWLKKRLPLLSQFLRTNTATFECEFFGVSAQGGVYVNPLREEKPSEPPAKEPLSTISPVERIKVVGGTVDDPHDITAPLKWLMR